MCFPYLFDVLEYLWFDEREWNCIVVLRRVSMVFYLLLDVLDREARLQLVSLYNTMIAFSFASRHLSSCAGNQ